MSNISSLIRYNANLSEYTTFQLGGCCKGLIECRSPIELEKAVDYFIGNKYKFIVVGQGSNIVVSDQGVDCYIIRFLSNTPCIQRVGKDIIVSAGTMLDHLVEYSVEEGLDGLVQLSGIPGTLGGAVVGNAGAFGRQISDTIKSVELLSLSGDKKEVKSKDLSFSYRNSSLKRNSNIVSGVRFSLHPGKYEKLKLLRNEILESRKEKHPCLKKHPSAGSFFRNVESGSSKGKRTAAGFFLDRSSAKRLSRGGAKVFGKHANIIIKADERCSAEDVFKLSREMQCKVKKNFNLDLVREVRFLGKFNGMPESSLKIFW